MFLAAEGRYGTLPELIDDVLLSSGWRIRDSGRAERSGYRFKVLRDGRAFAWPLVRHGPPLRAFHLDADGRIHAARGFVGTREPLRLDATWKLLGP